MKWQIWIEPNKIIEEEYPDGWNSDEVFEAASARWANKVTTVNPAPIGASSDDNNSSSQSNNQPMQLPSLSTLIVGAVVLYGLSLFGGNVEQSEPVQTNNEKMEYVAPSNNVIQYSEHHIDESIPEFFNTELQEETITDLGQDWDN